MHSYNLVTEKETILCQENPPLYDIKIFSSESQTGMLLLSLVRIIVSCYYKYSCCLIVVIKNESSCLKTNKCPGLCVMTPEDAKCLCADGLIAKNCIRMQENNTLIYCAKGKLLV